jgi:hypothetical protein
MGRRDRRFRIVAALPAASARAQARLPGRAAAEPPAGDGWLRELKHDGHRLLIVADGAIGDVEELGSSSLFTAGGLDVWSAPRI